MFLVIQPLHEEEYIMEKVDSATKFFIGGCSGSFSPPFMRKFGSLTTSFGLSFGDTGMFIDNGSGILRVTDFIRKSGAQQVYGANTHFHVDHCIGIPGNGLMYVPGLVQKFFIPKFSRRSSKDVFNMYFSRASWPVAPGQIPFAEFKPGNDLKTPCKVTTLLQNHPGDPGGSVAYRISTPQGDVVISTDSEPTDGHAERMAEFISGCALLYIDVQYRDAEYRGELPICDSPAMSRVTWGHGTPDMLFNILQKCSVVPKKIIVGHHDPARTDDDLCVFESEVKYQMIAFPSVVRFAREGEVVEV